MVTETRWPLCPRCLPAAVRRGMVAFTDIWGTEDCVPAEGHPDNAAGRGGEREVNVGLGS